ncbi:MAG: N-acetylmuramoyl-L-alanine amidase family protein [Thermoleophilia bacterium]
MNPSNPYKPPRVPDWRHEALNQGGRRDERPAPVKSGLPPRSPISKRPLRVSRLPGAPSNSGRQRFIILAAVVVGLLTTAGIAILANEKQSEGNNAANAKDIFGKTIISQQPPSPVPAIGAIGERARTPTVQTQANAVPPATGSLAGRVITIDPGHAANADPATEAIGPGSSEMKVKDPGGTSGVVSGTPEHVITLAIGEYLKQMLQAEGARVVMTRESDTYHGGNIERAQVANQSGSQLSIRIHCDGSGDQSTKGASTLYPANIVGWTDDIYKPSSRAAADIQQALVTATGATDKGTVERTDITGFNWSDVPVVLVEAGFLSNPGEDQLLNTADYQQRVARGLLAGIKGYFG